MHHVGRSSGILRNTVFLAKHVAVKAAGVNPVDPVLRRPMAFLVRDEKGAVVVHTHAAGSAKTGRDDLRASAVPADLYQRPA